jgi:hypothetical protein
LEVWRLNGAGNPTHGKSIDKPNVVMGINAQVCWEEFCNYWDVEMRQVPTEATASISLPKRPSSFVHRFDRERAFRSTRPPQKQTRNMMVQFCSGKASHPT